MHLHTSLLGFGGSFVLNRYVTFLLVTSPDPAVLTRGIIKVVLHDGLMVWLGWYSDIDIWNGLISAIWLASLSKLGRLVTFAPLIWTGPGDNKSAICQVHCALCCSCRSVGIPFEKS
jgi:hypothetical protein